MLFTLISRNQALGSPSLQDLASAINSKVSTITECHEENGLTQPGFAVDALRSREFPENPELEKAYMELIESASDFLPLALGPGKYLNLTTLSVCPLTSYYSVLPNTQRSAQA